jgi:hypothetical protein
VEGGRWEGTGDDICHVSGLVFSAVEQWNDTATSAAMLRLHMLAGEPHAIKSVQVGDILQFLNRTTGEMLAEIEVVSVHVGVPPAHASWGRRPAAATEATSATAASAAALAVVAPTVVGLARWPGHLDLGVIGGTSLTAATNIYNLNVTATQFVFRNNKVASGRRFGVLAKGLRMCIESNSFIGLGSGAVQFDYMDTEGLSARSSVVRNNVVTDVNQLATHSKPPTYVPKPPADVPKPPADVPKPKLSANGA